MSGADFSNIMMAACGLSSIISSSKGRHTAAALYIIAAAVFNLNSA